MTIQECYHLIGGDYEDVLKRMKTEERVKKYVKMFLRDPSYPDLEKALKEHNCEAAFQAAHTLKGVCNNLAFVKAGKSSHEITEMLRSGDLEKAEKFFPNLTADYEEMIDAIKNIEE